LRLEIELSDTPASHIEPTLSIYRKTTAAFLRKYFRMSTELGHLPSLLGREFFRTHVTSYQTNTFEDAVIFTHDVERCLERLPERLKVIVARIVFQEYTMLETAELTGWSHRTVRRWYAEALDRLAEVFVQYRLLEPIRIARAIEVAKELGMFGEDAIPAEEPDDPSDLATVLPPRKPPVSVRESVIGRARA